MVYAQTDTGDPHSEGVEVKSNPKWGHHMKFTLKILAIVGHIIELRDLGLMIVHVLCDFLHKRHRPLKA